MLAVASRSYVRAVADYNTTIHELGRVQGLLPAGIAFVGQLIVDAVVAEATESSVPTARGAQDRGDEAVSRRGAIARYASTADESKNTDGNQHITVAC